MHRGAAGGGMPSVRRSPRGSGASDSDEATQSLRRLRTELLPQTVGTVADTEWAVAGRTASGAEFRDRMEAALPPVVAFVFAMTFLLGFTSNGAVVSWLPLMLFVILFGLSMDYHVFVVSRIHEAVQRGVPTRRVLPSLMRLLGEANWWAPRLVAARPGATVTRRGRDADTQVVMTAGDGS